MSHSCYISFFNVGFLGDRFVGRKMGGFEAIETLGYAIKVGCGYRRPSRMRTNEMSSNSSGSKIKSRALRF